ncbi:helix-turn-helix domain-containing protein [Croceibacter atlanticus]|uniref:DNA-binding protein, putative n=1 Tax=Croceibacter atlanticus (strain ATCC BAA-628 / JCM 21780 / CIP 108009 / IAM 15332 / KCTC 12090 / HTCC2559) TaxID=216432 RepID=A3U6S9_CROAH|nr:helix-turn-helix transcriptional regulator [Croceibacter atlanticus]EAP87946.1 DNA-binding protein, putative [Croceibacter atlanticus HTCC2559]
MKTSDKNYLEKVGENIAKLRREKEMSQMDVCAIIDMDKPNLSAIENGRQNATILTLKKIANALEVDVSNFFLFSE